jgi:prepilin peptidase CpaA
MAIRSLLEFVPLLGLLLLAAAIDLRSRRLPNWLTLGLILSGLVRASVASGAGGLGHAAAGAFAGAAVPLVLFTLGAIGGGDVKLMAGVGAWVGPADAIAIFVLQCLIGLVLILCQALMQRRTLVLFRNSAVLAASLAHKGVVACAGDSFGSIDRPLPYAVPVGMATLLVLLTRPWIGF